MPGVILDFFPEGPLLGEIQRLHAARRKQVIKIAAADKYDRHRRSPHQGHGEKPKGDDRRDLVTRRIGVGRGINAQWNGDQVDDENRPDIQFDRHRKPFGDLIPNRLAVLEGIAEFEREEILQPDEVLNVQRFVEAILGAPLGYRLVDGAALFKGNTGAAGRAESSRCAQLGGIAGRQAHDQKADQGNADERRDHQQQTLRQVTYHERWNYWTVATLKYFCRAAGTHQSMGRRPSGKTSTPSKRRCTAEARLPT